jgi:hypothetical protein
MAMFELYDEDELLLIMYYCLEVEGFVDGSWEQVRLKAARSNYCRNPQPCLKAEEGGLTHAGESSYQSSPDWPAIQNFDASSTNLAILAFRRLSTSQRFSCLLQNNIAFSG